VTSALGLSNARFGFVLPCFAGGCAIYVMPFNAANSSDYAGSRTALPTLYELGPPTVPPHFVSFPSIDSVVQTWVYSAEIQVLRSIQIRFSPAFSWPQLRKKKKLLDLSQLVFPSQYIQFLTRYICHRSTPLQVPWPRLCRVNLHVLSSALRPNSY
jgi:hypothetical protein